MSSTEVASLLAAVVLWAPASVFVTQAIKRASWPDGAKAVLAVVCAALVGVAGSYVSGALLGVVHGWGSLTSEQVIAYAGVVYASATVWYHTYFAGTDYMKALAAWPR
jgi:hypothetical protein